jgi:hypothetical protein
VVSSGFDRIADPADITTRIRVNINEKAELRHEIARDNAAEFKVINGAGAECLTVLPLVPTSASDFPSFLEHIPLSYFFSYASSLSSLTLVKLGYGDLPSHQTQAFPPSLSSSATVSPGNMSLSPIPMLSSMPCHPPWDRNQD